MSSSPRVELHTIFEWCADVSAVRVFYRDVIGGVEETNFDADRGWLTYQLGGCQVVYLQTDNPPPVPHDWAQTFHIDGAPVQSWVLRVPVGGLAGIESRARDAGYEVKTLESSVGMLFLRDPTGRTIEVWDEAAGG